VALNDVDDILLSAAASKCFSKLTNVTTDDHVPATGRLHTDAGQAVLQCCFGI
jgi:hypothetical protein